MKKTIEQKWQTKSGLIALIIHNTCGLMSWLCGYVEIPESNSLHGLDYDSATDKANIDCHGGLTYSGTLKTVMTEGPWFLGFDCCHCGDSESNWPILRVASECESLADQIKKFGENTEKDTVQ